MAGSDAVRIGFEAHGGAGWREMVALRRAVLRWPLGLEFGEEELAAEAHQLHLALRVGDAMAGTLLLLRPVGGDAKLRQMAVAPSFAGRGLGRTLLAAGERELGRLGAVRAGLHARRTAEGFYRRCGYRAEGGEFEEVGLPHVLMRKRLPPVAPEPPPPDREPGLR